MGRVGVSVAFHYQYVRASSSRGRNDRVGDLKIFSLEPLKAHFSTLYLVMKRDGYLAQQEKNSASGIAKRDRSGEDTQF